MYEGQSEQEAPHEEPAPSEGVPLQAKSEVLAAEPETLESLKAQVIALTEERDQALKEKGELYRMLQKNGLA